jgi:hypothetical protein
MCGVEFESTEVPVGKVRGKTYGRRTRIVHVFGLSDVLQEVRSLDDVREVRSCER